MALLLEMVLPEAGRNLLSEKLEFSEPLVGMLPDAGRMALQCMHKSKFSTLASCSYLHAIHV